MKPRLLVAATILAAMCVANPATAVAATPEKARWSGKIAGGGKIAFTVSKPKTVQFSFLPPFDVRFLGLGYMGASDVPWDCVDPDPAHNASATPSGTGTVGPKSWDGAVPPVLDPPPPYGLPVPDVGDRWGASEDFTPTLSDITTTAIAGRFTDRDKAKGTVKLTSVYGIDPVSCHTGKRDWTARPQ